MTMVASKGCKKGNKCWKLHTEDEEAFVTAISNSSNSEASVDTNDRLATWYPKYQPQKPWVVLIQNTWNFNKINIPDREAQKKVMMKAIQELKHSNTSTLHNNKTVDVQNIGKKLKDLLTCCS
jgi:hypothetical protein